MINFHEQLNCGSLLQNFYKKVGPIEFGYWMQGIAAHILLKIGFNILEINSSGHPDILGFLNGARMSFEIETDSSGKGLHSLTVPDIRGLRPPSSLDNGYYALLKATIRPEWIILSYERCTKLTQHLQIPVIETYSDRNLSELWTNTLIRIILDNKGSIFTFNYSKLKEMALKGLVLQ